jgi:hypothetical protein
MQWMTIFVSHHLNMKKLIFIPLLLGSHSLLAQYYYKDIVSPRQSMSQLQLYKKNAVKGFTLSSFEANGTPSKDVEVNTKINSDYTVVTTYSASPATGKSLLTVIYDPNGTILRSTDSSASFLSTSLFEYNTAHQLVSISNSSNNYDGDFNTEEKHLWFYQGNCPVSMLCIKDKTDSLLVKFSCDNNGHPTEENHFRGNRLITRIYYYYDEAGRLTDIVRYNQKVKKLLPDMMFNYDENGTLTSMITVQDGNLDYQDWRYQYNEAGLKIKETCYGKHNNLIGKVEYLYQFK